MKIPLLIIALFACLWATAQVKKDAITLHGYNITVKGKDTIRATSRSITREHILVPPNNTDQVHWELIEDSIWEKKNPFGWTLIKEKEYKHEYHKNHSEYNHAHHLDENQ